ncbi:MAG: VIT domain-containing protein, partial [Deltaproteobacteria bacterium]
MAAVVGLCVVVVAVGARAEGALTAHRANGQDLGLLPLTHTDVRVEISGEVESVGVTQRFHNAMRERIEAVYVFPLPERAAVSAMEMHIGARVIRAEIRRRADAREAYDAARNAGR